MPVIEKTLETKYEIFRKNHEVLLKQFGTFGNYHNNEVVSATPPLVKHIRKLIEEMKRKITETE